MDGMYVGIGMYLYEYGIYIWVGMVVCTPIDSRIPRVSKVGTRK